MEGVIYLKIKVLFMVYQVQYYSHLERKFKDCDPSNGWIGRHNDIGDAQKERQEIREYYSKYYSFLSPIIRIITVT